MSVAVDSIGDCVAVGDALGHIALWTLSTGRLRLHGHLSLPGVSLPKVRVVPFLSLSPFICLSLWTKRHPCHASAHRSSPTGAPGTSPASSPPPQQPSLRLRRSRRAGRLAFPGHGCATCR
jgi:hypothetical protein